MTNSQRIIVNTIAQYTRSVLNVCLSLFSTRLILSALGQIDYGIYSVVGGVVAMLSFITNALVITTQRYLSYNYGTGDMVKIRDIFGNSMLLHLTIGGAMAIILSAIGPWVVNSMLNIESTRINAAQVVYYAAVFMLLITFTTAPIRALFIARENIVYISIIDVCDGILKLLGAIWLCHIGFDRLIAYAGIMTSIMLFEFIAYSIYSALHFPEFHFPHPKEWNKNYIKALSGFAGWTIYSTGCILVRTQGLAILLNRFLGTIINAAYGIALQVAGAVQFVSSSIINAFNPQIMKAEGCGNRARMLRLAEYESKYSFLLLSMVVIPLVVEMKAVLSLWLIEVPDQTVMFCRFVLIAAVCDQTTIGLNAANQAIGDIRSYSLLLNTIKVLTIPAAWICLHLGFNAQTTMWCYLICEATCAIARIPFMYVTAKLEIGQYIKNVLLRTLPPIVVMVGLSISITTFIDIPFRFLLTIILTILAGLFITLFTGMDHSERQMLLRYLHR